VLASGGGTNLQAIIDHLRALGNSAPGEIAVVVSDRAQAGALDRARAAGIEAIHVRYDPSGSELSELLRRLRIDMIALAGYLRLVPRGITREYRGRIVNVHPALLPEFGGSGMYGHRVHQAVIASGARESGATVHYVDDIFDHGDVIAQARVPVFPDDGADTLAARVLEAEHDLYPRVVAQMLQQIGSGDVRLPLDQFPRSTQ
jgi:formyltetrahydrofolate-dependent phosphoribosylglycinamide formyltransferase